MRVVILTVRGTEAATRSVLFLARISLDLVTNRQDRRHTTATALASRTCIGEARRLAGVPNLAFCHTLARTNNHDADLLLRLRLNID